MKSREEQREERRQYENDVFYELWRSGGNPDLIDYDRVETYRENELGPEQAASREFNRIYNRRKISQDEQ